jgi:hypothetical protein
MSYLIQHVTRAPGRVLPLGRGVRVDEHTRLNLPGYYAGAFVRVFVEDTSQRAEKRRLRRAAPPSPKLVLQIADCVNEINLEFDLSNEGFRENSIFKIETLLGALERFRDGLVAEAELSERRERQLADR